MVSGKNFSAPVGDTDCCAQRCAGNELVQTNETIVYENETEDLRKTRASRAADLDRRANDRSPFAPREHHST